MASSTIFWVYGMTPPGIELQPSGPLANTLPTKPMYSYKFANLISTRFLESDRFKAEKGFKLDAEIQLKLALNLDLFLFVYVLQSPLGGAVSVTVIVTRSGISDPSSNPGWN